LIHTLYFVSFAAGHGPPGLNDWPTMYCVPVAWYWAVVVPSLYPSPRSIPCAMPTSRSTAARSSGAGLGRRRRGFRRILRLQSRHGEKGDRRRRQHACSHLFSPLIWPQNRPPAGASGYQGRHEAPSARPARRAASIGL
jgi:hypothetical protein